MEQKPMKCLLGLLLVACLTARSQSPLPGEQPLYILDSLRKTTGTARFFAERYYNTTRKAILFATRRKPSEQAFLNRFEEQFTGLFLDAVRKSTAGENVTGVWSDYFRSDTLHPLRLQLLGINAHINGDIWKALVASCDPAELQRNKRCYFAFNRYLKKEFDEFYEEAADADIRLAVIREISPGLSTKAGHRLLIHWRKRQFKLARLHDTDPVRFRDLYDRISQKRESLNRLICNHF